MPKNLLYAIIYSGIKLEINLVKHLCLTVEPEMYEYQRHQLGMGFTLSPFSRNLIVGLIILYVVQIIAENWIGIPVIDYLAWQHPASGLFKPWQLITGFLLNGPAPIRALLDWLMLFFFLTPAQHNIGKSGILRVFATSWAFAVAASLPLMFLNVVGSTGPYLGLNCFITALIVVFGLARPNATINLMFVLPIKAAWLAWGTGFVTFLFFLFSRDLGSAISFFGWIGAVFYMKGGMSLLKLPKKKASRQETVEYEELRKRFNVINGGAKKDDEIYH